MSGGVSKRHDLLIISRRLINIYTDIDKRIKQTIVKLEEGQKTTRSADYTCVFSFLSNMFLKAISNIIPDHQPILIKNQK